MSRRRQPAPRESEAAAQNRVYRTAEQEPAKSNETPSSNREFRRVAMMLWGAPLILFIIIAVLKGQCAW